MLLKSAAKHRTTILIAALAVGALLMLAGRMLAPATPRGATPRGEAVAYTPAAHTPAASYLAQEISKETRLAEFFSLVEGAGEVRVMLGFSGVSETVFATDSTASDSITREEDSQGGTRETHQTQHSQQTVIISAGGGSHPLVVMESEPVIKGIVIIAQGGNDANVRAALTRAAQAVLGLEAHRIQVLTMRI